jgi:hypothetical protein
MELRVQLTPAPDVFGTEFGAVFLKDLTQTLIVCFRQMFGRGFEETWFQKRSKFKEFVNFLHRQL